MMGKVRHMLLILVVRVVSLMGHWVIVVAVETSMVVRAVIEVLRVVVSIVVAVLNLVVCIMMVRVVMLCDVLRLVLMVVYGQVVMHVMVTAVMFVIVHVLNVMVTEVLFVMSVVVMFDFVVLIGSMVFSSHFSVAVTLTVVSISWLIVVTSVWVMSKVGAFSGGIMPDWLVVAVVFTMLVLRFAMQVLTPAVLNITASVVMTRYLVVLHSGVYALILVAMAVLVTLKLILVLRISMVLAGFVLGFVLTLVVLSRFILMLPLLVIDFGLVIMMLVVMGVRKTNLLRVSMVVGTLGDNVLLLGASHSEVKRAVLQILVMVSIILVSMHVLRCHMMVAWVLVVV